MNAVVNLYNPNKQSMLNHLEHLFGGYLDGYHDGLVELAWTETNTPYKLSHARLYGTDQLEELADEATRLNSQPMCNVYVGAALRRPDTPRDKRASDADAWCLTSIYTDQDDEGSAAHAKAEYTDAKPSMVVVTGREPHIRAQLWWRLDEPLTDPATWPAYLRGAAAKLRGDKLVFNPGRVMRLAGTIAWPVKEGRSTVELTQIPVLKEPGKRSYQLAELTHLFPPVSEPLKGEVDATKAERTADGLFHERVTDGRERYMRDTLAAVLLEYIGTNGAEPTEQEFFDEAWPQYERNVDLTKPGRGQKEFADKCVYTLKRFRAGQIGGMRTLEEAIATYQARKIKVPQPASFEPDPQADPGDVYKTLTLSDVDALPPPSWLIKNHIPDGGLTFVYGRPGKGKSFFVLDMALRIAHGMHWHDVECKPGGVLYIAMEGKGGYRNRVRGWHQHHNMRLDGVPFRLLPQAVNFMVPADIQKLIRTVKAVIGDAKIVVVDTVARALPGAEENASKEMGLFIAACDAIREQCSVAVIGVHHSGKDEDRGMRGSSALEGAGDCVIHLKKEDDSDITEVKNEKQKDGELFGTLPFKMVKESWAEGFETVSTLVPERITDGATKQAKDKLPDHETCERIKNAIDEAWLRGKPWSIHRASQRYGRFAPLNISRDFEIPFKTAEFLLEEWQRNEVVEMVQINSRSAAQGLRRCR